MTSDMPELETLAFHWADAYLLSYSRDRWVALRRDTRRFLIAGTLTGLEHAIQDDYRHHPVSRASDPPGTADCLNLDDGDVPADGDVPDEETRFILAALRYAFPAWTITYSPPLRAWTARSCGKTICQNLAGRDPSQRRLPLQRRRPRQMAGEAGVTGLFIWRPIDDERQRSFVTATGTGRAASRSPQISRAGCAQTAVSACAVVARRRCRGGLSRCVTECSSPVRDVGGMLTVGSAPWTVDGVWLGRCPRRRSFSTDVPDNAPESHTAARPFPGPRQTSQSDVPDNRPLSDRLADRSWPWR